MYALNKAKYLQFNNGIKIQWFKKDTTLLIKNIKKLNTNEKRAENK